MFIFYFLLKKNIKMWLEKIYLYNWSSISLDWSMHKISISSEVNRLLILHILIAWFLLCHKFNYPVTNRPLRETADLPGQFLWLSEVIHGTGFLIPWRQPEGLSMTSHLFFLSDLSAAVEGFHPGAWPRLFRAKRFFPSPQEVSHL